MRSIHEIEKHLAEAHAVTTIIPPTIPREFGYDIKVNKVNVLITIEYNDISSSYHDLII